MDFQNQEPFTSKWGLFDLVLLFFLPLIVFIPIEFFFQLMGVSAEFSYIFASAAQPVFILIVAHFLLLKRYQYEIFKKKLLAIKGRFAWLLIFSLLIWGLAMASNVLFQNIARLLFKASPQPQNVTVFFLEKIRGNLLFLFALIIVVLVPFAEEVFFRGILYTYLRNNIGGASGMLLAASLFAFAHFEFWVFFPTFLAGLGFSYLFERYKSLWAPVIAHMVWNGMGFIMMVIRIYST